MDSGTTSRRSLLTAVGAGVAAVGLGPTVEARASSTTSENPPAKEFAERTTVDTRAIASGDWNDPEVWNQGVPGDGDDARIAPGVSVTLRDRTARLRTLVVDGELRVDPATDTHLRTETTVTMPASRLVIGTSEEPIDESVDATVTFVHHDDLADKADDPQRVSKGLITMGEVTIRGAETTGWTELASAPGGGDETLELPTEPTNWAPGDRVVVAPVEDRDGDELREVTGLDGTTVSLDASLDRNHRPPEPDLPVHVASLDRNVRFRSESTEESRRGHVMFMTGQGVTVANAGFYDLGRTDKSRPITNPGGTDTPGDNRNARYPLHFHETGIDRTKQAHDVLGCVLEGSPGWGFVNHHSYAHVRDCVSYDVLGSGFVAEGGDEQGSFVRNVAIKGEGSGDNLALRANEGGINVPSENPIDDFGHAGHWFWLHSPGVVVENDARTDDQFRPPVPGTLRDPSTVGPRHRWKARIRL